MIIVPQKHTYATPCRLIGNSYGLKPKPRTTYAMHLQHDVTSFFPFLLGLAQGLFNLYIIYIVSIIIELVKLRFNSPIAITAGPSKVLHKIAKLIRMGYLAFNFSVLALFWLLLLLHFSNQRSLSCGHTSAHHQQDQSKCDKPHDSSAFTVHCHPKTKTQNSKNKAKVQNN